MTSLWWRNERGLAAASARREHNMAEMEEKRKAGVLGAVDDEENEGGEDGEDDQGGVFIGEAVEEQAEWEVGEEEGCAWVVVGGRGKWMDGGGRGGGLEAGRRRRMPSFLVLFLRTATAARGSPPTQPHATKKT